jgi:hypothetical protein
MRRLAVILAVLGLLLAACSATGDGTIPGIDRPSTASAAAPAEVSPAAATTYPTIATAGDIACDNTSEYFSGSNPTYCQDVATANRVRAINPTKVIPLGDLQYTDGTSSEFAASYARSWGKSDIKSKTLPVVGNHEYHTSGASGYRNFFSGMDVGGADFARTWRVNTNWRVFILNSNCGELAKAGVTGSCASQVEWMKKVQADNPTKCTIAAYHHPFRNDVANHYPGYAPAKVFGQAMYDMRGEIVLNGHAHAVEISKKITPGGTASDRGQKYFTIGSGGKEVNKAWEHSTKPAWTDYRQNSKHAVLKLTLKSTSYDYQLVATDGTVLNSGTRNCF